MEEYKNIHGNLIRKCKNGDKKAQSELYLLYAKAMYNVAYRILGDVYEAEDTMQEAFIKAFQKIDSFSDKVSFGSWIKKIVINTSLDVLRKRKEIFESVDELTDKPVVDDEYTEKDLHLEVTKVRDAIMRLPQGYRIILSLYLLEGYDHDEISEILKISASTSRSQLTRAKKRLIDILQS